jgi:hydrogenase 3 maturation protease
LLTGRVCIVGVGNRYRGDDGAGPRLIDQHHSATSGFWIDAGVAPENYLEPIVRTNPEVVLIVDAVNFGGPAGSCQLLDPSTTASLGLSTHAGSLAILAEYLSARVGAQLKVLGIQPQRIDESDDLSDAVSRSVREMAAILSEILSP